MSEDELWQKIDNLAIHVDDDGGADYSEFSDVLREDSSTINDTSVNTENSLANLTAKKVECTNNIIPEDNVLDEKAPVCKIQDGSHSHVSGVVSGVINDLIVKVEDKQPDPNVTGIVYDERMSKYRFRGNHPECPKRILSIYQKLVDIGLVNRCKSIEPRLATDNELQTKHCRKHINLINSVKDMDYDELETLAGNYESIYFHPKVTESALLSAGCTLALMEEVLLGKILNGVAVVRPPGHHALNHCSMGFCHFNNVAVAAMVAIEKYNMSRILIVDWDVHYGNGTHKMFENDPRVLFYSMHRYDHGFFWPGLKDADYDAVGIDEGEGFNVHVAWNDGRMGDAEYLLAFEKILMPIAEEYNPELVIVSSGFDSGLGDPLGGFCVTPLGYAHMTHKLMRLAEGKLMIVLEGGYNLHTISESMAACVLALLNEHVPSLKLEEPLSAGVQCVKNTFSTIQKYWTCLQNKSF